MIIAHFIERAFCLNYFLRAIRISCPAFGQHHFHLSLPRKPSDGVFALSRGRPASTLRPQDAVHASFLRRANLRDVTSANSLPRGNDEEEG